MKYKTIKLLIKGSIQNLVDRLDVKTVTVHGALAFSFVTSSNPAFKSFPRLNLSFGVWVIKKNLNLIFCRIRIGIMWRNSSLRWLKRSRVQISNLHLSRKLAFGAIVTEWYYNSNSFSRWNHTILRLITGWHNFWSHFWNIQLLIHADFTNKVMWLAARFLVCWSKMKIFVIASDS